jgi:hypothetical protein
LLDNTKKINRTVIITENAVCARKRDKKIKKKIKNKRGARKKNQKKNQKKIWEIPSQIKNH